MTTDDLELRDATEEDFDLLYEFHRDTLKPYVRDARAWDEAWQLENFRQHFRPEHQRIITHKGRDIGTLSLHDHEMFLLLDNIALAPELRNQGIGTIVIRDVLDIAKRSAIPVSAGGALIAFDAVIDDERERNAFGLLMSLNMLIETPSGFDYIGADCQGWMAECGFSQSRVEHLVGPDSMVIGIK